MMGPLTVSFTESNAMTIRIALLLAAAAALCVVGPAAAASNGEEEYLIVPAGYTPAKAWPLIVVSQNQVSEAEMAKVPYFAVYGGTGTEPLLEVARKYHIDPRRIYATGFSRSGHGLLETAWTCPDRFAAIAPVCEDMREKEQYKIQKIDQLKYIVTPTYLWHGANDSFLKTGRRNFEIMTAAGCPVWFGTFPGGHSPDGIYFRDIRRLTDFFDHHTLDPFPKRVLHVIYTAAATRAFWVDALMIRFAPTTAYPFYEVRVRDGNVIEVEASEAVGRLILHLSGKLVEMDKPVTVVRGGKELYKGRAAEELIVTVHEGKVNERRGQVPLWEQLEAVRSLPNWTGAHDWLYLDMHTAFDDPRLGRPVARRISLDLGFRPAGGAEAAKIAPDSKAFASLKVHDPAAAAAFDLSGLSRKLPVTVTARARCFSLAGSAIDPGGADPIRLVKAGEGKSGQVALVEVRLTSKADGTIACAARLTRNPYMQYPHGMWSAPDSAPGRGILEYAGTRGISWQFIQLGNEAYQVLAFISLDAAGVGPAKPLLATPTGYRKGFFGVQREATLKGGSSLDLPVLLISVPCGDYKAAKPAIPDLAKIIDRIAPELAKAIQDMP